MPCAKLAHGRRGTRIHVSTHKLCEKEVVTLELQSCSRGFGVLQGCARPGRLRRNTGLLLPSILILIASPATASGAVLILHQKHQLQVHPAGRALSAERRRQDGRRSVDALGGWRCAARGHDGASQSCAGPAASRRASQPAPGPAQHHWERSDPSTVLVLPAKWHRLYLGAHAHASLPICTRARKRIAGTCVKAVSLALPDSSRSPSCRPSAPYSGSPHELCEHA